MPRLRSIAPAANAYVPGPVTLPGPTSVGIDLLLRV